MTRWLQSGRRRDICVLLVAHQPCRGQELKSLLESHYDERLDPKSFYGSLSALVDTGFVVQRSEGIHDVYELSTAGEQRLREQYEWMRDCLEEELVEQ